MKTRKHQLSLFGGKVVEKSTQVQESFHVISIHKNDEGLVRRKRELYMKFLSLSDHLDKKKG